MQKKHKITQVHVRIIYISNITSKLQLKHFDRKGFIILTRFFLFLQHVYNTYNKSSAVNVRQFYPRQTVCLQTNAIKISVARTNEISLSGNRKKTRGRPAGRIRVSVVGEVRKALGDVEYRRNFILRRPFILLSFYHVYWYSIRLCLTSVSPATTDM